MDSECSIRRGLCWRPCSSNCRVNTSSPIRLSARKSPLNAAADLLIAADEHQELNRDEACVCGILADLVCGWVGVSGRRHMLNAVEATRRALRGGLKVG